MMQSRPYPQSVVRTVTLAATLFALVTPVVAHASAFPLTAPVHALMGGKEKTVHFSLRNQSGDAIDLRAGDKVMTLAAGQTMELKLPVGTRIVTASKTEKREAGAVICEVSASTADTTIVLN